MISASYFLIIGLIASFLIISFIVFKLNIKTPKIPIITLLFSFAYLQLHYIFYMLNYSNETADVWYFLFINSFIYFLFYFIFYIFAHKIKHLSLNVFIPIIMLFLLLIIDLPIIQKNWINLFQQIHPSYIMSYLDIYIFIFSILTLQLLLVIFNRRYYLIPVPFLIIISILSILIFGKLDYFNILFSIVIVLSPILFLRDIVKLNNITLPYVFNDDDILNALSYGIISVHNKKILKVNKYMLDILFKNNEDINNWFDKNKINFENMKFDILTKMKININNETKYFYIQKLKLVSFLPRNYIIVFFDINRYVFMERLLYSKQKITEHKIRKSIYEYSTREELEYVKEFLKGFSHNSLNLISVLSTGIQFIKEILNNMETLVFSSKNINSKRDLLKKQYYDFEKVINVSDESIEKIFKTFKLLKNKITLMYNREKELFTVNDFIKQEVFYNIDNTKLKYECEVEMKLNENNPTITFDYYMLSIVFRNIINFLNYEKTIKRKKIYIETLIDNKLRIIIKSNIINFNKYEIDKILNNESGVINNYFGFLYDCIILLRSEKCDIKRIKENQLGFEIILNI